MNTTPVSGYYTLEDMKDRFHCSTRTLDRWMKRERNPLPRPRIGQATPNRRWAMDDVWEWEQREAARRSSANQQSFQPAPG